MVTVIKAKWGDRWVVLVDQVEICRCHKQQEAEYLAELLRGDLPRYRKEARPWLMKSRALWE